jgi:Enoyl-CoA hydratase/isomerase
MKADQRDLLNVDLFSAVGPHPVLILPARAAEAGPSQAVKIGIDEDAALKCDNPDDFDILLTSRPDAPRPWVSITQGSVADHATKLADRVRTYPTAATILAQVLRIGERLDFDHALQVESFAYSTLLGGAEFSHWLAARSHVVRPHCTPRNLVLVERDSDHLTLTLNDPDRHNAFTAEMRDAFITALANIIDDPTSPRVTITAAGKCFSTGGYVPEFGEAKDLAVAHVVRTLRSCTQLIWNLGERATVRFHGAAIGSGLEVAAAAARREATNKAWFQLPELQMGLIPGAGGTASLSRAIGRHRTMWMAVSGKRISAQHALSLGLIHALVDA